MQKNNHSTSPIENYKYITKLVESDSSFKSKHNKAALGDHLLDLQWMSTREDLHPKVDTINWVNFIRKD